jgi:membrane-bound lytic murein transglycosylase B
MKKLLLPIAAVAALAVALFAVASVGAQEGTDGTPVQTFVGKLAAKLGISEDQLATAVKDVELEMVDEALAEGRITEEQAAEMRDRIENGELRFPGGRGPHGHVCAAGGRFVYATAEVLGIEESAVIDGLQAGKSLVTIAGENGMGADEFKAALTAEVEEHLAEKVAAGTITQAQADRMLAKFNENVDRVVNFTPDASGEGACRGPRPGGFAPDGAPTPEAEGTGL